MQKILTRILVAGLLMAVAIELYAWSHHMFVTGLNPFLGAIFLLLAALVTIPLVIWGIRKLRWPNWQLFAAGTVCCICWAIEGSTSLGQSTLDIHLSDTYIIIYRVHAMEFSLMIMIVFTWICYLLERFGYVNRILGRIHFSVTFLALGFFIFPPHYEGLAGMPRRYVDYSSWASLNVFYGMNWTVVIVVMAFLVVQLVFVGMVVYYTLNVRRKKRI